MFLRFIVLFAVLLVPSVVAVDFTENFESFQVIGFDPEYKPDQDWYNYEEGADIGNVTRTAPIIEGSQSFRIVNNATAELANGLAKFELEIPVQLTTLNFTVEGATITDNGVGSQQYVAIQSSFPVRRVVEFYLHCRNDTGNSSFDDGCQLKVRWQQAESDGVELVPYSSIDQRFTILVTFNWNDTEFCLTVDGVDDGCFPFFELPNDVGRLQFQQYREDIPLNVTFDVWTIQGAINGTAGAVTDDAATGISDFAADLHFTSPTSLFIFGIILFIILMAALIVPMFSHGESNALAPASAFYALILVFWLIQMEFWPDWIGITLIIIVSSMIGLILRRVMLGIRDANSGPSLVVGSLGYFIICATFLAMAGYSSTTIEIPAGVPEETGASSQSFGEAVLECVVVLFTDCSQETESTVWKTITDIFGWIQAAFDYLFQLLTFQLPIPVVLNIMIVLPPAATLAAYAIQIIRGI